MRKIYYLVVSICALILMFAIYGVYARKSPVINFAFITTHDNVIPLHIETVQSNNDIRHGLMFRRYLADNGGMLFIYDQEKPLHFWMKNTVIPLDILFINSNNKIVDIQTMAPCLETHCKTYTSRQQAKYALEVNQGFAQKNKVLTGDIINFRPNTDKITQQLKRLDSLGYKGLPTFAFLFQLQHALKSNDIERMANMISYPLTVNGKSNIKNKAEFIAQYPVLFTRNVKQAITQQTADSLFANYQGIMIGNGEVWYSPSWEKGMPSATYKIISINSQSLKS